MTNVTSFSYRVGACLFYHVILDRARSAVVCGRVVAIVRRVLRMLLLLPPEKTAAWRRRRRWHVPVMLFGGDVTAVGDVVIERPVADVIDGRSR